MSDPVTQITSTDGTLAGARMSPCPFCGEAQRFSVFLNWITVVDDDTGVETDGSSISCDGCSTYGPVSFDGLFGAVTGWNARRGPQ